MDTRQLTSSQGEADGVSDGGMTLQALGGGKFALRLVLRQRAALFYQRTRTHTHTTPLQMQPHGLSMTPVSMEQLRVTL